MQVCGEDVGKRRCYTHAKSGQRPEFECGNRRLRSRGKSARSVGLSRIIRVTGFGGVRTGKQSRGKKAGVGKNTSSRGEQQQKKGIEKTRF
jgi:hypothetical protein